MGDGERIMVDNVEVGGVLSKSRRLLDFVADYDGQVSFSNEAHVENPEDCTTIVFPRDDFLSMGGPQEITITIEPGSKIS